MKDLILRLLQKRGIQSVDELDKEEKKTVEEWQSVLSKDELTLEDLKGFCQSQIGIIESKWADYNLDDKMKHNLIPYHTTYKTILNVIESPKAAREALEKNLVQLLNQ
jgi:hypothetical protein